jgi:hypothetical protein
MHTGTVEEKCSGMNMHTGTLEKKCSGNLMHTGTLGKNVPITLCTAYKDLAY